MRKSAVEELSKVILMILIAIFILHVINGTGGFNWIRAKFSLGSPPRQQSDQTAANVANVTLGQASSGLLGGNLQAPTLQPQVITIP